MKKNKIIILLVVIVLIILCGFYLHYENTKLSIKIYNIENEKIPSSFNDYKIVQISDFHNTKNKRLTNDLVKEIKKQNPNMIVITGDLIDSNKYDLATAMDFINAIKDVAPIYYVSGNHEAWVEEYDKIESSLTEIGIHILDDTFDTITINDDCIYIFGISDSAFYPSYISDQASSSIDRIIDDIDDNGFKLLLSHRPELFEIYGKSNIDLVLTGHAHGGQVRIPFVGGLIAPDQGFFPKYSEGIFEDENTQMIVSRGIGNSVIPFRVNNRPELVIIILNNK